MNIRNLFSASYWDIHHKEFHELYDADIRFNASFREQIKLPKSVEKSREMKYIRCYRMAQVQKNTIWARWCNYKLRRFSERTGIGLYANLSMGKGLIIGHCGTIVVNESVVFGNEMMLTHGVTIGRDVRGKRKGSPTFGNRVCVRTNSTVVGNVHIGDDVLIAPNTFVNFDVPSHSIVIGNPAKVIHRENATEGHLGILKGE